MLFEVPTQIYTGAPYAPSYNPVWVLSSAHLPGTLDNAAWDLQEQGFSGKCLSPLFLFLSLFCQMSTNVLLGVNVWSLQMIGRSALARNQLPISVTIGWIHPVGLNPDEEFALRLPWFGS